MVDSVYIANNYSGYWLENMIQTRKENSSFVGPVLLSVGSCVECGGVISARRKKVLAGVCLCVDCQGERE